MIYDGLGLSVYSIYIHSSRYLPIFFGWLLEETTSKQSSRHILRPDVSFYSFVATYMGNAPGF